MILPFTIRNSIGSAPDTTVRYRIVLFLTFLFALLLSPRSYSASVNAGPPVSRGSRISLVWDQGVTIADLDGDGLPDLAVSRGQGWSSGGFQYRVDVSLTTAIRRSFFNLSAEKNGILIAARDVDGDRYLDLIISNAGSHTPVGVWINDGKGKYTQGSISYYPSSIWYDAAPYSAYSFHPLVQATAATSPRSPIELPAVYRFYSPISTPASPLFDAADYERCSATLPQTRAPPLFSV